jgi:hypothetical protein
MCDVKNSELQCRGVQLNAPTSKIIGNVAVLGHIIAGFTQNIEG